jgi:hypothetical protein
VSSRYPIDARSDLVLSLISCAARGQPPQNSRLRCDSCNVCSQQAVDEAALLATLEM